MQVLIIDTAPSPDESTLRALYLRGYDVITIGAAHEALELIRRTWFDCIVVGIPDSGEDDLGGLPEIRQFVKTSAVAFMTTAPAESFVLEALAEGSIELQSAPGLIAKISELPQPALIVGTNLDPGLIPTIRDKGLRVCSASTLQLAMNLLVDGWCQIVLLDTDIPGVTRDGKLAIFHQIHAKQLAILASALSGTPFGIVHTRRPQKVRQYIELFEHVAGSRPSPCGLTEPLGKQSHGKV